MRTSILLFPLFFFICFYSCRNHVSEKKQNPDTLPDQESLIRANQRLVRADERLILERAGELGWILKTTGTGVFYQVIEDGKSHENEIPDEGRKKQIKPGDRVSLTYSLRLLNGKLCYESSVRGPKQFAVEESPAESGMHEALQLLHPGDSARIILPPHRAFGLVGDGDKIPGRAILWYEIRVDSVSPGYKI